MSVLSYDAASGVFTWLVSPSSTAPAGAVAGYRHGSGYWLVGIMGRYIRRSRLAWFYVHGEWPAGEIDHINNARDDDRIANLRKASRGDNNQNRSAARKDSATGIMGVSQRGTKWRAAIFSGGKILHLGTYDTAAKAQAAYLAAKAKLHNVAQ